MPEPLGPVDRGYELQTSPNGPAQSIPQGIPPSAGGFTRRVHHKKSASDTFAFAAGRLFETTPQDLYNLCNEDIQEEHKHQPMLHASPLRVLVTAEHDQMQVSRSTRGSGVNHAAKFVTLFSPMWSQSHRIYEADLQVLHLS